MLETQVPAVYLNNTRQKLADSFSKGTFQLSLTQLDSIYHKSENIRVANFHVINFRVNRRSKNFRDK